MIEIITNPDKEQWSNFIYKHPNGNIFQTPEMAGVYRHTKNYEPITIAAIDTDSDSIIAMVNALVIKQFGGLLGKFTGRSIIQGGPLFINNKYSTEAVKLLMESYDSIVREKIIYTEIRNMWEQNSSQHIFEKEGYEYIEHLNFLINLDRPIDSIWQDIHKSRRKGINRATKNEIALNIVTDKKDLQELYNIIHETYKNVKTPLADISLLESAFNLLVPNNLARFYGARCNNKYVGARVVLNFKGLIYDWYAGDLPGYSYVNEALVWCILKDGANNGYTNFDFGGAGSPYEEYGVREFKRRFGGNLVNYGRYRKIHNDIIYYLARKAIKLYRNRV